MVDTKIKYRTFGANMRFGLLCILLLFNFDFIAQTGKVKGFCFSVNDKPIPYLTVSTDSLKVKTNNKGFFEIELPASKEHLLVFYYDSIHLKKSVSVAPNEVLDLGNLKFRIKIADLVVITKEYVDPTLQKISDLDLQKLPTNSAERTLIYTTSASSNNELTSNYNVRGGSYDENLVYINGFLVNRPFITRAGQQEGMSIVYSSLVKDLKFSGGGFDARYGDKLSSVLDISYKNPDSLQGSVSLSLLGIESHIAQRISSKFNYLAGVRYRSNGYLLNALPTKGSYNPIFYDGQFLTNYDLSPKLTWSNFLHLSSNQYRFAPQSQETDFGTVNEAYRLNIYFDGQEHTSFQTLTAGTSLKYKPLQNLSLDLYASVFKTNEIESFDVLAEYFINQLETDPSKENVGDSVKAIGVGGFLNHARNELNATLINFYHNGSLRINDNHKLFWGLSFQHDIIIDQINEWKYVDSAGYSQLSTSNTSNDLVLNTSLKSKLSLETSRVSGYLQHSFLWSDEKENILVKIKRDSIWTKDTVLNSSRKYALQTGVRFGYTEINQEMYLTPRISFVFFPRFYFNHNGKITRRNAQFRLATGLYYQPPAYREFRTLSGSLNLDVKSQKSFHFIAGYEHHFAMWNRKQPFKLIIESYYKYLWDVNAYSIDNVRTRYVANNDAVAYAYGMDVNVHGEFVEGVQSFFKVGMLSTKENLLHDSYTTYYNKSGEEIIYGYTDDDVKVDSIVTKPGYIPRPTDQLLNAAILFQDKMPRYEMYSAQLGLQFGTRLPYGPPGNDRYKDTLRQKSYFRVDLGISYDLLYKKKVQSIKTIFSDATLSFEVYNLMGVNNVLSHQWVQDVSGRLYSIPNYLTQRRFNLKLILRF
jgi:hypothetical protein